MSPALSGSSALQRVKLGDALEIRDGIIFDFYPGLPHIMYIAYLELWYMLSSTCTSFVLMSPGLSQFLIFGFGPPTAHCHVNVLLDSMNTCFMNVVPLDKHAIIDMQLSLH